MERLTGTAAEIHARDLDPDPEPTVWIVDVDAPALVLGSTQPEETVDHRAAARAGIAVVRRRSGGGAVLVDPDAVVWIDVVLPAGDRLWRADVGEAPVWLGQTWAAVARTFDLDATVLSGPMPRDPLARIACFVGRAPGEVTVGPGKLVGLAQRRSRAGVRFQCALLRAWEPSSLLGLLAPLPAADAERVRAAGFGSALPAARLVDAFLTELALR